MAERKKYDPALVKVGELITEKRKALGDAYKSRESFIGYSKFFRVFTF